MATVNDLLNATAAFLNRDRSVFVKHGFDCLLQAANNARLYAERYVDFELAKVSVKVPNVDIASGGSLDNAVLYSDGVTPVNVKKIAKCFVAFANNSNSTYPIAFYSRNKWLRRVQRKVERLTALDTSLFSPMPVNWTTEAIVGAIRQFAVIQMARTVYLVPIDPVTFTTNIINLYFDVWKWLPRYGQTALTGSATSTVANQLVASAATFITSGVHIGMVVTNTTTGASAIVLSVVNQTTLLLNANIFASGNTFSILLANEQDFLIDNCFDWLMYRSIFELNFMLKEDERVQLSEVLISDAWAALRAWNENLIQQSVDDTDLD